MLEQFAAIPGWVLIVSTLVILTVLIVFALDFWSRRRKRQEDPDFHDDDTHHTHVHNDRSHPLITTLGIVLAFLVGIIALFGPRLFPFNKPLADQVQENTLALAERNEELEADRAERERVKDDIEAFKDSLARELDDVRGKVAAFDGRLKKSETDLQASIDRINVDQTQLAINLSGLTKEVAKDRRRLAEVHTASMRRDTLIQLRQDEQVRAQSELGKAITKHGARLDTLEAIQVAAYAPSDPNARLLAMVPDSLEARILAVRMSACEFTKVAMKEIRRIKAKNAKQLASKRR